MKNRLKIAILSCIALGATGLTAFSQASVGTAGSSSVATYMPILVPLPTLTLAAGTGTNFYNGWTNTTTSTNQTITYAPSTQTFVTNTTITTNNALTFASIYFPRQSRVALEYQATASATTTTNIFTFAKSITGRKPDTLTQFTWSIITAAATTAAPTVAITNFPADFISGEGWLFVIQQTNSGTGTLTNNDGGLYWASKPGGS